MFGGMWGGRLGRPAFAHHMAIKQCVTRVSRFGNNCCLETNSIMYTKSSGVTVPSRVTQPKSFIRNR